MKPVPVRSDVHNALLAVLHIHQRGIEIIADSWRLLGAKAVCIWDIDKQCLACSPRTFKDAPEWNDGSDVTMSAPLLIEGQVVGQLGVLGLNRCV